MVAGEVHLDVGVSSISGNGGDVVHYVGESAEEIVEVQVNSLHPLIDKSVSCSYVKLNVLILLATLWVLELA